MKDGKLILQKTGNEIIDLNLRKIALTATAGVQMISALTEKNSLKRPTPEETKMNTIDVVFQ